MKEKLIRFTRRKEILKKISVLLLIFIFCNMIIKIKVLNILWFALFAIYLFIRVLANEKEEVLRKNNLVQVFLANSNALIQMNNIAFIVIAIMLGKNVSLVATCIIAIIFLVMNNIISQEISDYFKKKIK